MISALDYEWMTCALKLAERGLYSSQPNPRVGAILVKDGQLIAEGCHQQAGQAHAEVNAFKQAGTKAQGATLYVTLEPCNHQGKTPACTQAIIAAGVKRVVAAMQDPNPLVAGQGFATLKAAGIEVEEAVLSNEAEQLNQGFCQRMRHNRPYVRLKMASSLDGRTAMANGESKWITGLQARADVQHWRARSSVIITGIGTLLADNPALTVRSPELEINQQPLRVVLDTELKSPLDADIFQQEGRTLLVTLSQNKAKLIKFEQQGIEIWQAPKCVERIDLNALLSYLAKQEQANEVLVEAGATLAGAFLSEQLVDEIIHYQAMTLLGSSARPLYHLDYQEMIEQQRLELIDSRMLGSDLRLILKLAAKK